MSHPCTIETCKRKSRALCHCCNKNLCLDHIKEHQDLDNSQLNTFVDEINILSDQVSSLNIDETIINCRQTLDKWRDDCHMIIDRFYQEKCKELKQHCFERVDKQRKQIDQMRVKINDLIREQEATNEDIPSFKATINDIRRDIKQFEEEGITVDARPLIIEKNLIYIEKCTLNEFNMSSLSFPSRNLNCSNDDWPVMAANNRYLLLDQYPNLYLFDKELSVIKQSPWEYNRIPDMCWSSTLNSFIIIADEDGIFLVNENITSIEPIQTIEKKQWLSCTCSDADLFLTMNEWGSKLFQFNLLSSFQLIKQWNCPHSCETNELIHNIAYNKGTLALIIGHTSEKTVRIELRSSTTLDRLWSLPFGIENASSERITRVCSLKCDEWLVIDYKTSHLLQISKDGKIKITHDYKPTPHNAVLFGSNILAIRTTECVNIYRV